MTNPYHNQSMRALSWKQPYASLMLKGKIETRKWDTKYRGLVLICASKIAYQEHTVMDISGVITADKIFNVTLKNEPELLGQAIAVGRLVDSRPMRRADAEKCFVEYYTDLYCHVYEDVKAIKPFNWTGSQGWKTVDQRIVNSIELL